MSLKAKVVKLMTEYGYRIDQYREARQHGRFIEFWLEAVEQPATTTINLKTLNRVAELLGTDDINVTGGNFDRDQRGDDQVTRVLLTAYGVAFPRR